MLRFFKAKANNTNVWVSQQKRLLLPRLKDSISEDISQGISEFWVIKNDYLQNNPIYVEAIDLKGVEMRVEIEGHSSQGLDSGTTHIYDKFQKCKLPLPNTCIEAAEHALKCMYTGVHHRNQIPDGDVAKIFMCIDGFDGMKKYNIDEDSMEGKSYEKFKNLPGLPDASNEIFTPGEGMALVYSLDPNTRKKGWTVHAAAIVMKSRYWADPWMIVVETFSEDEEDKEVEMSSDWRLAAYMNVNDFASTYAHIMRSPKYRLWKLKAEPK